MTPILMRSFVVEGDDGESYMRFMLYKVDVNLDMDEWVRDEFPAERCQHEYDCCGRFYPDTGTWLDANETCEDGRLVIIKQNWRMNV